jgi:two-component system response regulator RegA
MVENQSRTRVLVVDDDVITLRALERDLRGRGFLVQAAPTRQAALDQNRRTKPQLAVVDLHLGEESGIELVEQLKEQTPEMMVIMLSGNADVPNTVAAFHCGAVDFLQKPITGQDVVSALERVRGRSRRQRLGSLARVEADHIASVLQQCDGNISEAARRLKVHRRSLQRKLQKRPPVA